MYSVYASGASAIAVPGCPALAFWTASMDSPRIVSIDSFWISRSGIGLDPSDVRPLESRDHARAVLRRGQRRNALLRDLRRRHRSGGAPDHGPGHPDDRLA